MEKKQIIEKVYESYMKKDYREKAKAEPNKEMFSYFNIIGFIEKALTLKEAEVLRIIEDKLKSLVHEKVDKSENYDYLTELTQKIKGKDVKGEKRGKK